MAPKKNTNTQDENNNSSQQGKNTDANNNVTNNNKGQSGNSQRIGGDGPRAKPVSRSKKAVSSIKSLFSCSKWWTCLGCDLSCSSNFTSFEKSKSWQSSAKCHCCLHGWCSRIFSKFQSVNLQAYNLSSGCWSCWISWKCRKWKQTKTHHSSSYLLGNSQRWRTGKYIDFSLTSIHHSF